MSRYRDRLPPEFSWRPPNTDSGQPLTLEFLGTAVGTVRQIGEGWMATFGSEAVQLTPSSLVVPNVGKGQGWLARTAKQRIFSLRQAKQKASVVDQSTTEDAVSCK